MSTDRIEKNVTLRAPRERVWNAIADAVQFGAWFGMEIDQPFVAGTRVTGRMVPTTVDPAVATMQEPYRGMPLELAIERVEPMTAFAFRWHPFAIDKGVDYSHEPTTLVTFELGESPGGTTLRITETGFDRLPVERRAKAFASNDGGWTKQVELITRYLAGK